MAGMNVDGLISGLDTTSLISQLLQVEAAPQQALRSKVATETKVETAYQLVNTRFAALQAASDSLIGATAWSAVKATSSTSSVTATSVAGADTGALSFYVDSVATAYSSMSSTAAADTTSVQLPTSFDLAAFGTTTTISSDGSLADVAAKVNAAGIGVRATVVKLGDADYRLQLAATKTGANSTISLYQAGTTTPIANGFTQTTAASDAVVRIGGTSDPTTGVRVQQATNTFTDILKGTTFTVSQAGTAATVTVSQDSVALASKVKGVVDAANALLDEIAKQTSSDPSNGVSSPLTGDVIVRNLQQRLLGLVSNPAPATVTDAAGTTTTSTYSLKAFGVQLTKDGHLAFSADDFAKAYADDPSKTQQVLTTAFVTPARDFAQKTSAPITGTLSKQIQSVSDDIDGLNRDITDWDARLAQRKEGLQRQFANLEVSLGHMKDQSSWLAGQLASLPSWGG